MGRQEKCLVISLLVVEMQTYELVNLYRLVPSSKPIIKRSPNESLRCFRA